MRGFTLAESILALGLCSIVLLLVIALAVSAHRGQRKSSLSLVGHSYASQTLETFLYALPPSSDNFWSSPTFANPYFQDQSQIGPTLYQSQLHLQPLGSTAPGMLRCTVNVSWSAGSQLGQQNLSISRLIYAP